MTYSAALTASGGSGSYTWKVGSGTLPKGVALDSTTGALSGVAEAGAGTYPFTVQVQDDAAPTQATAKAVSLTVVPQLALSQASTVAINSVGTAYSATINVTGGVAPYSYSVHTGTMPSGVQLKGNQLVGTLTTAGLFSFSIQVTDSANTPQVLQVPFLLTVTKPLTPLTVAATFPSGQVGSVYAPYALAPTGGTPAYSWSVASGALPAGLTLSTSGIVSGTPTVAGVSSFVLRVADSGFPMQITTLAGSISVASQAQAKSAITAQWFVRPDGGTRYSTYLSTGQCDGKGDAAYPGKGVNQHCAFNDVRWLYQDGNYDNGSDEGWIISGGDTVIIRGSIGTGATYRIGWNNQNGAYEASTGLNWGKPGDPYASGMPVPPAGTVVKPTRILGENYGSCHAQSSRTQLHGGFGVSSVINLNGAQYVDLECLDITDFSACGRSAQLHGCNTSPGALDDYASTGISQNNKTTHVTMTDVRIHGTAGSGLYGATGDGDVYDHLEIVGNASSGWNADDGTVGIGSTTVSNFDISWNGCAEEYPMVDALPYSDCTDDNVGGYGDGFGTATIIGTVPWNVTFNTGTVTYNTQDGLDALHLNGPGSTMTITAVTAYGNMGQQLKVGGNGGTITNSLVVTNCNALRQAIPGTPAGYNTRLSDFCRAADAGIYISTQDGSTVKFDNNTIYSASSTTIEVGCGGTCKNKTDLVDFRDNVILGFVNSVATGYPGGGTQDYSNPVYLDYDNPFTNPGSTFDHNVTFHSKSNWVCPSTYLGETNGKCVDPGLVDESWHNYGIGNMTPISGVRTLVGAGVAVPGITVDITGTTRPNPPSIGAYE